MFSEKIKNYHSYFTDSKEQLMDNSVYAAKNGLCIVSTGVYAPNFKHSQRVLTVRLRKVLQISHTKQLLK